MSDERKTSTNVPRDEARQDLDDLTVLAKADGAGLDEARLTVAKPAEVDEAKLGSLATIHQGSRSAPSVGDLSGLMTGGGVRVETDIAGDTGRVAGIGVADIVLGQGGTDTMAEAAADAARPAAAVAPLRAPPPDAADTATPGGALHPEAANQAEDWTADREAGGGAAATTAAALPVGEPPPIPAGTTPEAVTADDDQEEESLVDEPSEPAEPTNAAPVILGATGTAGAEDHAVSGAILAADADGDALAFTLAEAGLPAHGTVTLTADGTYTYLPAADWSGTDSFTVNVSDGRGGVTTRVIEIEIEAVNDAPAVTGTTGGAGGEDSAITGAIAVSDVDGDALTFALVENGSHGTVTLNPDGTYTYLPVPDWSGDDSFTVRVSDGRGGTVDHVVAVEVAPVADAPSLTAFLGTAAVADDHDALGAATDDVIAAGHGGQDVYGGAGDDTISGGTGLTTVFAGSGDDVIDDTAGRYATIVGGSGDDTIATGQGKEVIFGDGLGGGLLVPLDLSAALTDLDGSESLTAPVITGLPDGASLIETDTGLAILLPGGAPTSFDLTIAVGATEATTGETAWTTVPLSVDVSDLAAMAAGGADTIASGSGMDTVYGGGGDDVILGEGGADTLYGGAGADTISGGAQADIITGGGGDDLLMGDSHADTFLFETGFGRDSVDGGTGTWTDTVDLTGLAEGTTLQIDLDDGRSWTVTTDEAEHVIDLGDNVSGTVTVEGTDDAVRFDNIEEIRW
ncbi:MAG: tandem-95 repeat protein [Pseudomonadota bacterium]